MRTVKERTTRVLAGTILLVTAGLAVAGLVLQLITRDVPVEYYGVRGFQGPMGVMVAGVGWLIATRRRRNALGWLFLGAGMVSGVQAFNSGYLALTSARSDGLPLIDPVAWLSVWIWVFFVGPLGTFALQRFPEEALTTRPRRALAAFSVIAIVVFGAGVSLTPGQAGEAPLGVDNPYANKGLSDLLFAFGGPMFIGAIVLSAGGLIKRFRRSRGELRQQMKLLTFAAAIAAVFIAFSTFLLVSPEIEASALPVRLAAIGVILGFVGIPVAAGIAVLRYGLFEIDVVINKTLVYAILAVFITMIYVAVVIGIGALVGAGASTELTIGATAIVALAIQPMRARANRLANRLVFGKRSTPYEALSSFSSGLASGYEAEDVLPRLARLMTEATAATSAGVWLAVGDNLRPAGVWPARVLEPQPHGARLGDHVFEVRYEEELLGALAVEVSPAEPLSPLQEQLLADLASQAGLLMRNVRLIEELRSSRQRLVAAQDMERRRIERNLHDGAQQQLVALAVNLKLARQVVESDPATATGMLEQMQTELTDALENLRALARGIYPPLLAERGLVEALRSQADKAALPVVVEGEGIPRYRQDVESAVYFCVLEALQNVAKYARAGRADVVITATEGRLAFSVTDDGGGFDAKTVARGAGLTNMADRIDALGGRLEVRSAPGEGTTVRGWVSAAHD